MSEHKNMSVFSEGVLGMGLVEDAVLEKKGLTKIKLDQTLMGDNFELPELGKEEKVRYKCKLPSGADFSIISRGRCIEFFINKDVAETNSCGKIELASFMFDFLSKSSEIELFHRQVTNEGKKLGISGSEVLALAEEYVKSLLRKRKAEHLYKNFVLEAGQFPVIEWALKNGYRFKDKDQEELYTRIKNGEDKTFVVTDKFKKSNGVFGGYIVKSDELESLILEHSRLKAKNKYSGVNLIDNSLRFNLVKDIWPEEETQNN